MRDLPEIVINAGNGIADPDRRVLAMLGARGSHVAADDTSSNETVGRSVAQSVRAGGLEPPCLAALLPKSSASTNFATLATNAVCIAHVV